MIPFSGCFGPPAAAAGQDSNIQTPKLGQARRESPMGVVGHALQTGRQAKSLPAVLPDPGL
jgi:hypothetical protein